MQSSDANPNNLTYIEITYIITNIPSTLTHQQHFHRYIQIQSIDAKSYTNKHKNNLHCIKHSKYTYQSINNFLYT